MSLTLEVPELGHRQTKLEFLLAGLAGMGQAGPASLKTRKYFASFFILSEVRNATCFLSSTGSILVSVLFTLQKRDSFELGIKI